jgi:hypothetical protein
MARQKSRQNKTFEEIGRRQCWLNLTSRSLRDVPPKPLRS